MNTPDEWRVTQKVNTKLLEVIHDGILVEEGDGNGTCVKKMKCDTVIIAVGLKADHSLEEELKTEGIDVQVDW